MALSQNKLIGMLVVALVVVSVASLIMVMLVRDDNGSDSTTTTQQTTANGAGQDLNLEVFQRQAYQRLYKQLIQEGALPVQPPPVVGKANPFL